MDGTLVSRFITSSVATRSNWENDGVLRRTITAGGAAEVADRMFETLPTKNDAKSSAVWPIDEDGAGGRSSTSSFRQSARLSCLQSDTADDQ